MRFRVSTELADSLIKGSFELSCPLMRSGKTERSYAKITDKIVYKMDIYGEQKGSTQKDKQKRYGGNFSTCGLIQQSVFLFTFVTPDKSKSHAARASRR